MKQKTVKKAISWQGTGLHTGEPVSVTVAPADENFGIKFRIASGEGGLIKADIKNVSSTHRSTNIKSGDIEIMTIEHLMAAMYAAEVSNAEVIVDGRELPILDGSSAVYFDELISNIVDQEGDVSIFSPSEAFSFIDEQSGAEYTVVPSEELTIEVIIDYSQQEIGQKYASYAESENFKSELSSARTFVFTHEVIHLAKAGYIKGGSIENAMVLRSDNATDAQFMEALKELGKDNPADIIKKVNNGVNLKYDNEPARHKLLDLYGDLALLGSRLKAKIIARKPGHTGNVAFTKKLKEIQIRQSKLESIPQYDPNATPVYDTEQVKSMLPHRYPFMMVDKIIELSDTHVVGVKNITFNENFFMGHFPGNSVFPGVLQMEALAQTGGILALSKVETPSNWDTYFVKMDAVKFKRKVVPGDTLILKMELLAPIRRGMVQMRGTTYVGNQIASEGDLTAQIVDRTKLK
jgi:UDP-3-O-[3-hydroxymyristoyl] N-acetylglucosamine deacetylase/3-hydroxyacyl-[acyl-carrier-protein] dehydratase